DQEATAHRLAIVERDGKAALHLRDLLDAPAVHLRPHVHHLLARPRLEVPAWLFVHAKIVAQQRPVHRRLVLTEHGDSASPLRQEQRSTEPARSITYDHYVLHLDFPPRAGRSASFPSSQAPSRPQPSPSATHPTEAAAATGA